MLSLFTYDLVYRVYRSHVPQLHMINVSTLYMAAVVTCFYFAVTKSKRESGMSGVDIHQQLTAQIREMTYRGIKYAIVIKISVYDLLISCDTMIPLVFHHVIGPRQRIKVLDYDVT